MAVVVRWVVSRMLGLLVARYRWATRLVAVVSVVRWLTRRRRSAAVVRVRPGEALVIGLDDRSSTVRGSIRGR